MGELYYRIMGTVAGMSARMRRFSVNAIPSNYILIIVLCFALYFAAQYCRESLINKPDPRITTLTDILQNGKVYPNFVTMVATVHGKHLFARYEGKDDKHPANGMLYVPITEPGKRQALIMAFKEDQSRSIADPETPIYGMLRKMPDYLRSSLNSGEVGINDLSVDTNHYLRFEAHPVSILYTGTVLVVVSLVLLLFVVSALRKYTVFRPMPSNAMDTGTYEVSQVDSEDGIDMRITGKLFLNPKCGRRFLDVPVGMGELDSGETVFASNIDASTRMYGVKTNNLEGMWISVIQPGTVKIQSSGFLYASAKRRPAMRITFVDQTTEKPTTAILSFGNDDERRRVEQMLFAV